MKTGKINPITDKIKNTMIINFLNLYLSIINAFRISVLSLVES